MWYTEWEKFKLRFTVTRALTKISTDRNVFQLS